jgi:hypothetical protein
MIIHSSELKPRSRKKNRVDEGASGGGGNSFRDTLSEVHGQFGKICPEEDSSPFFLSMADFVAGPQ